MRIPYFLLGALVTGLAAGEQDTKPQPAVAGVIRLFDTHPVVLLGEIHRSIQFDQLLKDLIAEPEFAAKVNDIVVEMGNALHQPALDGYVRGEDVPEAKLRAVWQDVVGAPGGIAVQPYHGLFTAVRERNRRLPAERRIRVLAGDPPIDWTRVRGREDIAPFLGFRDEHYASVVRHEVLAKRRKALLIMGSGHFLRRDGKPGLVEQQMIGSFVKPYVIVAGSDVVRSFDDVDTRFAAVQDVPAPWLMEMKGTWVGAIPRWTDAAIPGFPGNGASGKQMGTWQDAADAFLFLGQRDTLTTGGEAFDLENTPYGEELRRRWQILFPKPPNALPKSDGKVSPLLVRVAPAAPAIR